MRELRLRRILEHRRSDELKRVHELPRWHILGKCWSSELVYLRKLPNRHVRCRCRIKHVHCLPLRVVFDRYGCGTVFNLQRLSCR